MSKPTESAAAGGRQRPTARPSSKGSSSTSRSRLARRLWEWAMEEMKYACGEEGALRQEDLQVLVRGDLAGLLEFVVQHVKSPNKAEIIQGSLLLHNLEGGGGGGSVGGGSEGGGGGRELGRVGMERESRRLAREEASLRMAVEQMTKDVAQLRENITQLAETGREVKGEVSRVSRGTLLFSAHSHVCLEMTRALQEFARRIRARVTLFHRQKGGEECYFTRQEPGAKEESMGEMERGRGGGGRREGTTLESACTHTVRVICSQLEKTLYESHTRGQSDVERKKGMDHCWRQIESLLTQHTPAEILSSLEEVTQHTTHLLHSHTLSIDLNRDAQQLKYSYDSNGGGMMKDVSEQPSLLHAVEELLLEAQLSHIQRSVDSERAQTAVEASRTRAAELQTQAALLLQEIYRDQPHGEEALELAKLLYSRLELECAGSRAALARLRSICSSLDEARNQRRRAVSDLQTKLRKIQEFAQDADSKQKQIRALVAHNSSARDRLQSQYRELQSYVEEQVLGHHEELTRAAEALRDSVAHEIHTFSGLSLDRILKPPSSEVPTCDLSINRLDGKHPSGHPSWAKVTRSLGLSPNLAPDRVLPHLLRAQEKVHILEGDISEVNQVLQQMRVAAVSKDCTQDLLQRCRKHDSRLMERAIPALQDCLSRASSALAHCERTAETLDHWWSQPAQFLVPWATHSGFSTQQWVDQWKVLTANFAELQGLNY